MADRPAFDVTVREVGLRDGLQMIRQVVPTAFKRAWIDAVHGAGVRAMEVASFVPPKYLPQMADAAEVVAHALTRPGLEATVLVPNLKGAERAVAAGARRISLPVSASRAHSRSNLNKTPEEAVAEVAAVCARFGGEVHVEAGIATAFACSMQGAVPEDDVLRVAEGLAAAGVAELGLADTVGYANPAQVTSLVARVRGAVGPLLTRIHLHDTMGLGLANAAAALAAGIRRFDASLGGLGGCPYAPGASGNVVAEDLVFMLESMGVRTGIDLPALIAARALIREALPEEPLYGAVGRLGPPKTFRPAA